MRPRAKLVATCCFASLTACAFPVFSAGPPRYEHSQLGAPHAASPRREPQQPRLRREQHVTVLDEPYDVVSITRSEGALRFHIATKSFCRTDVLRARETQSSGGRVERGPYERESSHRGPCNMPLQAAPLVDLGLQVGPRLVVLGTSSQSGDFELSLSKLDTLFADRVVALNEVGQVLIHGAKAAEIPLGEILHRKQLTASTLDAADRALAAYDTPREQLESRLAELMELKQQGADDPRLREDARMLYERLHPTRVVNGETTDLSQQRTDAQSFDSVMNILPSMCGITVMAGEVAAGALMPEGFAVGFMVGVINRSIGNELTEWLTNRCCEMTAGSLQNAKSIVCDTDTSW